MPKRPSKAQASSTRAASGAFGVPTVFGQSPASSGFGAAVSPLSCVSEPPDFSSISDPNIVVAFKNLSKKDGTTKSKALEDLQILVAALKGNVEDAILEVWVTIYPRTSIDNARRVRQLAHAVHGQICLACGKRTARYMPQMVGSWLAGLSDNDRAVAKAAQDALHHVFPTPEKLQNVRKAYLESLLNFCQSTIDNETPRSLSDERTASPDELETKYSRVIAAVIALATNLLEEFPDEAQKQHHLYVELIQDQNVWAFSHYNDVQVRRSLHRLLKVCLEKHPDTTYSSLSLISKSYIYDALKSDQTGTSLEFVECLVALLKFDNRVWANNAKDGKSFAMLCRFLKRGSQMGHSEYWATLVAFFRNLPSAAIFISHQAASEVLSAMRSGITKKTEPRANLRAAWSAFVDVTQLSSEALSRDDAEKLIRAELVPLVSQYLVLPSEKSWGLPEKTSWSIVSKILEFSAVQAFMIDSWPSTIRHFVNSLGSSSSPTESTASQYTLETEGSHLIAVQAMLWLGAAEQVARDLLRRSRVSMVHTALEVVQTSNGISWGAASFIESALHDKKMTASDDPEMLQLIAPFVRDSLPRLMVSPSAPYLAGVLFFVQREEFFTKVYEETLRVILNQTTNQSIEQGLSALLTSSHIPQNFDNARSSAAVEDFTKRRTADALRGNADWSFLGLFTSQKSSILPQERIDGILVSLTSSLSEDDEIYNALQGLNALSKANTGVLESFAANSDTSQLIPRLLYLEESSDDTVAQLASEISTSLQLVSGTIPGHRSSQQALLHVIQKGLSEASDMAVSIATLSRLARDVASKNRESNEVLRELIPNIAAWKAALSPFLATAVPLSLSITSDLKGAVHLLPQSGSANTPSSTSIFDVPRDADGFSIPLRMAQYTVSLLQDSRVVQALETDCMADLFSSLVLTIELANENLSVAGCNQLWAQYSPETETDMIEFVCEARKLIHSWLEQIMNWWSAVNASSDQAFVHSSLSQLLESGESLSQSSLRSAGAYCTLVSELIELHGWQNMGTNRIESQLEEAQKKKQDLVTLTLLTGFKTPLASSQVVNRMCNTLIANMTGLDIQTKPSEALRSLVLLNGILQNYEGITDSVAKQRVVFFIKHVIPWLSSHSDDVTGAEIYKTLTILLPVVHDIYGNHWQATLVAIVKTWSNAKELNPSNAAMDPTLSAEHASLRLFAVLRQLVNSDDPNDDLVDVWCSSMEQASSGLFNLLHCAQTCPDEFNQPLRITNELVARQISRLPNKSTDYIEELYPLLFAPSHSVQEAAFTALHKKIPDMQEQISLDAALDKTNAKLPEELMSLVLEAPTINDLDDTVWEKGMPLPLKGYLLSWLLIFDHFETASHKVKNDYLASLRDLSPLPSLLSFTFDFLGHSRGNPADVSKFDVTAYDPALSSGDAPHREVQHILSHLYYLSLKHVSSLTKSWWLELRSRTFVSNVEQWTEKFISPHIIAAGFASVTQWSDEQSDPSNPNAPGDGENLKVSISPRAKEIKSSYDIDDTTLSMLIRLPAAWPLHQAEVYGVSRVAVDEKKWQSWLRGCQGVISFSNNSIVDGLVAFRRNVVGAVKGQTECAICYSLVSVDKQLPSKRCSTCKNLFHSGCLFKWFKTSNNSTCPLCRNPFNYG